ncbi:MAG: ATP-binding protein [Phycisphaerales bacterium]
MELRSNPLYLSGAREMVAAVARRLGFTDEACGQIALAVDEALCNVIRHGYDRAADRPIWISLWPLGESGPAGRELSEAAGAECCRHVSDVMVAALRIVIEDEARQVDPGVIKSRNLDEVRPGGLGVHIIRAVMDDVKYEHRSPKGMRLSMLKRRVSASTDASDAGARAGGCCTIQCVNGGGATSTTAAKKGGGNG